MKKCKFSGSNSQLVMSYELKKFQKLVFLISCNSWNKPQNQDNRQVAHEIYSQKEGFETHALKATSSQIWFPVKIPENYAVFEPLEKHVDSKIRPSNLDGKYLQV